jgi:hypothetical protein
VQSVLPNNTLVKELTWAYADLHPGCMGTQLIEEPERLQPRTFLKR